MVADDVAPLIFDGRQSDDATVSRVRRSAPGLAAAGHLVLLVIASRILAGAPAPRPAEPVDAVTVTLIERSTPPRAD